MRPFQIRRVPIHECEPVPWLNMRHKSINDETEPEKLLNLGRSLIAAQDPTGRVDFNPTSKAFMFEREVSGAFRTTDAATGQIHPIVVMQFPQEIIGDVVQKKFGIILGNRRWLAAHRVNEAEGRIVISHLEAKVVTVSSRAEYDDPFTQLEFMTMAFVENTQRSAMSSVDITEKLRELESRYYDAFPEAKRPGRRLGDTKASQTITPSAILDPPKDTAGGKHGAAAGKAVATKDNGTSAGAAVDPAFLARKEMAGRAGFARYTESVTGISANNIKYRTRIAHQLSGTVFKVWAAEQISEGAIRVILPIPKKLQDRVVRKLLKEGHEAITIPMISEAVTKDPEILEIYRKKELNLPANPAAPPSTKEELLAKMNAIQKVACMNCATCAVDADRAEKCPIAEKMLIALEVAADVCSKVAEDISFTPSLLEAFRPPLTRLAIAASKASHQVNNPDILKQLRPSAFIAGTATAAA